MKISGIYKIINRITGKYYVGSSMNIMKYRWPRHKSSLNNNNHKNDHLQNSWNKYGEQNFELKIVEELKNIDKQNLLIIEQKYLDIAKTEQDKCYNLKFVAGGGGELSEYSRNKISIIHKGKTTSDETKLKISNSVKNTMNSQEMFTKLSQLRKGKFLSKTHRLNLSKSQIGRKHSPETIEKIRQSHLGSKNPMYGKRSWNYKNN